MKHVRLYEEHLSEKRKSSTLPPVDFDWKKAGSRLRKVNLSFIDSNSTIVTGSDKLGIVVKTA